MTEFYKAQLNEAEKELYASIVLALGRRSESLHLPLKEVPHRRMREISFFVTLDHPDFYWTKGSFAFRRRGLGADLRFPFLFPKEELAGTDALVGAGLTALLQGVPREPLAAAETLCRRLRESVAYDLSQEGPEDRRNQSIWSVFVRKKSVCMGMAKALNLAFRLLGMDSVILLGSVFGDRRSGHSWNLLRVGTEWLHVDATMGYDCFAPLWERRHPGTPPPLGAVPFEVLRASHTLRAGFPYPGASD